MKKLLLFLLLIPAFTSAQTTYWSPGVPPGSTPLSPTFRAKSTGTDSLTNLYVAIGNKTFQLYTGPQSWSYWSRLFKGDPKDPLNPLTIAIGDSTVTSFNNFGIGTNSNGDIVYMPFNYSPSMGYILFTQKINANSGLQTNASIASGAGTFLKQNTSTGLVEKDTSHYQTALSFGGGLTLSGTAVSLGGAILSGNTAGIELQYDGVNSTNFNVLDANTGTGIITGNSASGTETALSSARSDFVYTTLLDLNEGGVSFHAAHGLKAMGFSWNASTTAPISVTDSINNKGLANTSDYSAYEVLNDNAYMSRKAVRVYGNTLWATSGSGVTTFNTRTGAVTLSGSDVTTALGYTPVTNARTLTINGTAHNLSADQSWTISAGDAPMNGLKKYPTDSVGMGNTPITHYVNMPIQSGAYVLMGDTTNFVGLYVDDTSAGISGEDTVNNYNSNLTAGNNGTALMKVTNGSIQRYIKSSVQPSDPLGGSVIHYDSENKPIFGSGNYWTGSNGSLLHDSAYIQTGGVKGLLTGYVPTSRTISTSTGLTGGGDLSANLTLKADTATLQTVLNFFPKGDTRYLKSSSATTTYVPYSGATGDVTIGTHKFTANNAVFNLNSGSVTPNFASPGFQVIGGDGLSLNSEWDSFGDHVILRFNRFGGTRTSRSALSAHTEIAALAWGGSTSTTGQTYEAGASHIVETYNAWSSTDHSTDHIFKVVKAGDTVLTSAFEINQDYSVGAANNITAGQLSTNNVWGGGSGNRGFTAYATSGTSNQGYIELVGPSNNTANAVGTVMFEATSNTLQSNYRIAQINAVPSGSTTGNLGGKLNEYSKADNGSLAIFETGNSDQTITFPHYTTNGGLFYGDGSGNLLQSAALTGLIKGNGTSAPTAATAGTDYLATVNINSSLTGSGATGSALGINLTNANIFTALQTSQNYATSGNITQAAWGNATPGSATGIVENFAAATYTDNSTAAGTLANVDGILIKQPAFAASNATVTFTSASTLHILNGPAAGSGAAISNSYAIKVDAGLSSFVGGISTNNNSTSSNLFAQGAGAIGLLNNTAAGLLFGGASNISSRTYFNGQTSTTITAANSYGGTIFGAQPVTMNTSGTSAWLANVVINGLGTVTNASSVPITNTASLYVNSASSAGSNNFGVYSEGNIFSNTVIKLKGYTVSTLPTGHQGDTAFVTDALTPAFGGTLVGGGAIVTKAFYNGTNWIAE